MSETTTQRFYDVYSIYEGERVFLARVEDRVLAGDLIDLMLFNHPRLATATFETEVITVVTTSRMILRRLPDGTVKVVR